MSGRQAEIAARRLGEAWAARGEPAEIRVLLRDGGLAARFACPTATPAWTFHPKPADELEPA